MAKKKRAKGVEDHIAELEAVVGAIDSCPACGGALEPGMTTCPHCGTPVHEAVELQAKAAESLEDLGRDLEETLGGTGPPPAAPTPEPSAESDDEGLASAAAVAEHVDEPEPRPSVEVAPPAREAVASVQPETEMEPAPVESPDLEGFIAQIEAEVGVEAPAAPSKPAATSKTTARAVHRSAAASSRTGRWTAAAVAGGVVLYLLSMLLVALLGKVVVASVMVVGTVLVVAGINGRTGSSGRAPKTAPRGKAISDYVCPLCGTEISANAAECPTCGAVFED